VAGYDDFPILLETWRTCLQDMFDLDSLMQLLAELESGEISWSSINGSHPSPMGMSGSWRQINEYMYRDDSPSHTTQSALREDLVSSLLTSPGFQPDFTEDLISQFESKRKRESKGYAPQTARDLLDWVIERIMIPAEEWERLLARIETEYKLTGQDILVPLAEKLAWIRPPGSTASLVVAMENVGRIISALYGRNADLVVAPILPDSDHIPKWETMLKAPETEYPNDVGQERIRLLGEWLSFYGPISEAMIIDKTGLKIGFLKEIMQDLAETGRSLIGPFMIGRETELICDKENFSILLRLKRLAAVPVFDPLPISALPYFIAKIQGLTGGGRSKEQLYQCLEQLSCYGAPAAAWESEILPARLDRYDTSWLDSAMQASDLMWVGCGHEQISFCFQMDLDLIQAEPDEAGHSIPASNDHQVELENLFPDMGAGYDFSRLQRRSTLSPSDLSQMIWGAVWQGKVVNDTALALRKGIENRFTVPAHVPENKNLISGQPRTGGQRRRHGARGRISKWKPALPFAGYWRSIQPENVDADLLEAAERTKERIRVLLDRYGIIFRELLVREQKEFQWGRLFRSLRLMELSGEIVSGYFFVDIPGPQFMSHKGFQILQRLSPGSEVYWLNAQDPASLCGIALKRIKDGLPPRHSGTHLVYRGDRLVLVSRRNGGELTFHVAASDPDIQSYLGVLRHLISRQFQPRRQITVEVINDQPAAKSPFVDALKISFDVLMEHKNVVLYRRL